MRIPIVNLRGEHIHAITERQCVSLILERHQAGDGGWVATHNLDHLRRLRCDRDFAELCRGASLRVADGMPLIWASRIQGTPLPARVAGSDLVVTLATALAKADHWLGVRRIELTVDAENLAGMALYRSAGFFEQGRLRADHFREGGFADGMRMVRFFPHASYLEG